MQSTPVLKTNGYYRPRPVYAVRWESGIAVEGLTEHPPFVSKDPFLGGHWPAYATLDGKPLHEGDWIVMRPDGTRRVLTDAAFGLEYEQVI
jgi:hypothetical protein